MLISVFSFCLVKVNALDSLGQTSLHRAAHCGHLQTCRLLLSYGCDPNIISLQGFTALQMGNENVQQLLQGSKSFRDVLGQRLTFEILHMAGVLCKSW
jgi:hypothetical protein